MLARQDQHEGPVALFRAAGQRFARLKDDTQSIFADIGLANALTWTLELEDARFEADRQCCAAGRSAVVLAAAGNSGSEAEMLYPAAEGLKGLVSLAASTAQRQIARFSNVGSWIHVAAPGELIVSTVPGGGVGTWSGTSMAAPLAAGVAAVVLATPAKDGNPQLSPLRQWRPEDVAKRLTDRSAYLCGASLRQIDAAAAVLDAQASGVPCP